MDSDRRLTLKLTWMEHGRNWRSNSSLGTGGTIRPSGAFLRGSDLPFKEPYSNTFETQFVRASVVEDEDEVELI